MRPFLVFLLFASPVFATSHDEPVAPAESSTSESHPIRRDPQSEDLEALKSAILELGRFNPPAPPKSLPGLSHPVGEQKASPGSR